jgi:hypothetical protein
MKTALRILAIIAVFLASLYIPYDADLGWHLKYGEYVIEHGHALRQNIFSSTMTSYHWVNHSWATDVVTYLLYRAGGFPAISIAAAVSFTLALFLLSRAFNFTIWEEAILFPLLIYFEIPFLEVSWRSQLLSLTFIGALFWIIRRYEAGKKHILWLSIPLMICWSNFHGEFILGLILLWGWTVMKRPIFNLPVLISLLSSILVMVHPFGIGIYLEILNHFGNPMQKNIVEWLPLQLYSFLWWKLVIWGALVICGTASILYTKKLRYLPFAILSIVFLGLSFWMRRYTWPMMFISLPVLQPFVAYLAPETKKMSYLLSSIIISVYVASQLLVAVPSRHIFTMNWDRYCTQYIFCSPKSAQYLREHHLTKNLLTFYNWGGWLIWQYPDIKPSIDGRMPFWKDDKGQSAFAVYYPLEQNITSIEKTSYDIVYMTPTKPLYKQMTALVKKGEWNLVYHDQYAGIFVRR